MVALQSNADRQDMSEVMTRLDEVLDRLPPSEHNARGRATVVDDGRV